MCGITGSWGRPGTEEALSALVAAMARRIASRGPDDTGSFCEPDVGLAFGHRRLSILDLSPHGHQPMSSRDGRFVLCYNGEIYNFRELAGELADAGVALRGHSDTEVLVEAVALWGLEATLPRLIGMFAFALWDRRERRLELVRDRLGIKPLYYGVTRSGLVFGSDLAALRAHPDFDPQLNRDAVALLLRLQYVPCPYSIYLGIHKLAPGHRISLTGPDALTGSDAATPLAWWDPIDVAARASREPFGADGRELTDEVERVLGDAVEDRMVADVPLGAFLSGGIDSSTVVALMQARSREPVKTFTIGFREDEFDEASHARAIAAHLGTDHTELYLDDAQARDVVPLLPGLWTEPFADPSQIPTYLVSRLARQSVTVSLSGDGGDELFGGYTRYRQTVETWNDLAGQPGLLKLAARAARAALSPDGLEALGRRLNFLLPASARGRDIGGSLRYRSDLLSRESIDDLYRYSVGYWHDAHRVVKGAHWRKSELERDLRELFPGRPEERMMLLDTLTYLPDDILTKVDRASMAVSLEARVPILDHRVFELAWRIPIEYRVRDGAEKWPLREVLARHVPRKLFERPKQGFGAPVTEWLRGGLNDWGEALLDPRRLRDEGIFEPEPVRRMWTQLQAGQPISTAMWTVLVFQAWWENERGGGAS